MAEKYKLALSRGRVFEFNSTVVFYGEYKEKIDLCEAQKALKMLSLKEPVITSVIELRDASSAYIVTQSFAPQMSFSQLTHTELCEVYEKDPLTFYNKLFDFKVSSDGYLVIAGHTAVCDAKSLLRLACSFVDFYEKKQLDIIENKIFTFSEHKSLPVDVASPIIDKLSAELDNKWHKNLKKYDVDAYKKARNYFLNSYSAPKCEEMAFSLNDVSKLREYCSKNGVDLSSLIYFSFYKSLLKNTSVLRSASKMRIYGDRRFFHGNKDVYSVGAYNGTVDVSLNAVELKKPVDVQLKKFHLDTYRALTSPFRVFFDDVLQMQVEPSLCDASYMCLAGIEKSSVAKKFAKNHGCECYQLCDCAYYNLNQEYWSSLKAFCDIGVFEPFKLRSGKYISFVETSIGGKLYFKWLSSDLSQMQATEICNDFLKTISHFTQN